MQTADRSSSLPDFVIDGPHLIFRELNKNEADKRRKLKKTKIRTDGSFFQHNTRRVLVLFQS